MSREATLKRILDGGLVAVVRAESGEQLVRVVRALAEGGVTAAEITFTVPDAVEVIRRVRRELVAAPRERMSADEAVRRLRDEAGLADRARREAAARVTLSRVTR